MAGPKETHELIPRSRHDNDDDEGVQAASCLRSVRVVELACLGWHVLLFKSDVGCHSNERPWLAYECQRTAIREGKAARGHSAVLDLI